MEVTCSVWPSVDSMSCLVRDAPMEGLWAAARGTALDSRVPSVEEENSRMKNHLDSLDLDVSHV